MTDDPGRDGLLRLLRLAGALLFLVVLLRHAWVCDDAYITFRTVDNFVHFRGLVWNVGERVQSYTHPLWMLLFSIPYFITREAFYTAIFFSTAISAVAVWLVGWKHARSPAAGLLGITVLTSSLAFMDYSTSGLENPLTHLLLGAFLWIYLNEGPMDRKRLLTLSLLACGVTLNRMDAVLFVLPPLVHAVYQTKSWRNVRTVALGFAPLIAWELFSLVYYGFPFPNTAYAKLGTGIPAVESFNQGFMYFVSTLDFDPLTVWMLAAGLVLPFCAGKRPRDLMAVAGALLYILYLVKIGGDFMLGRFLSAALYVVVVLMVRHPWVPSGALAVIPAAFVVAIGALAGLPTIRADSEYKKLRGGHDYKDIRGIADERAFYEDTNGLLSATRTQEMPTGHTMAQDGLKSRKNPMKVVTFWATGMSGYYAGPDKHSVDHYALTDPLLARLPALHRGDWRIGHFERAIPDGYLETLETGKNVLVDPKLAKYYDQLHLAVSGPIFSGARLAAIWRLNTGSLDNLVDTAAYRDPQLKYLDGNKYRMSASPPTETIDRVPGALVLRMEAGSRAARMTLRLDAAGSYRVSFGDAHQEYGSVHIDPDGSKPTGGLRDVTITVPEMAVSNGYDVVRIASLGAPRDPMRFGGWTPN